jgi:CIC family chloride channel protein
VALFVPEVLGIGAETLRFATIEGAFTMTELAVLTGMKLLMTVLCLGFGFAGGVFSPALLIGILYGALSGMVFEALLPMQLSEVVVYAICGMMAVTSPVIGAPLTTILIVFELTRSYDLTVAAMVAVVISNLIAFRLFGRSFFDVQLKTRGFDLSFGRDKAILGSRLVRHYMTDVCITLPPSTTIAELRRRLVAEARSEAIVVHPDGQYLGRVLLQEALARSDPTPIEAVMREGGVRFNEDTTVWEAMTRMRDFIGEAVPVVSSSDGRFLGVCPEAAVIEAYVDAAHELRREENEAV